MRRREFIELFGGAMLAWPLAARAQQPTIPMIGFLPSRSETAHIWAAFYRSLNEAGFVEGQNVAAEYRLAESAVDRQAALADFIRRPVSLIVVGGSTNALAAKAATATIPIVFHLGGDPETLGLVASLARPGGNITGVSRLAHALTLKHLKSCGKWFPKRRSSRC